MFGDLIRGFNESMVVRSSATAQGMTVATRNSDAVATVESDPNRALVVAAKAAKFCTLNSQYNAARVTLR